MRDFYAEIINLIVNSVDDESLIDDLNQYHASDIADAFVGLSDEQLVRLYDILPKELLADIITYIETKNVILN